MVLIERPQPLLLKPGEVASLLGISKSHVYGLIADGRLPATRISGSVRVPRAALEQLIEAAIEWPEAPLRKAR